MMEASHDNSAASNNIQAMGGVQDDITRLQTEITRLRAQLATLRHVLRDHVGWKKEVSNMTYFG